MTLTRLDGCLCLSFFFFLSPISVRRNSVHAVWRSRVYANTTRFSVIFLVFNIFVETEEKQMRKSEKLNEIFSTSSVTLCLSWHQGISLAEKKRRHFAAVIISSNGLWQIGSKSRAKQLSREWKTMCIHAPAYCVPKQIQWKKKQSKDITKHRRNFDTRKTQAHTKQQEKKKYMKWNERT